MFRRILCLIAVFGFLMAGLAVDAKANGDVTYEAKIKALKAKEKALDNYSAKIRKFQAQDRADIVRYDSQEKTAAAGAAQAAKVSAKEKAFWDKIHKVTGFIPVYGLAMRQYNAGEMRATLEDLANFKAGKPRIPGETYGGLKHMFIKTPAALPEHAASDFVWQFTGSDWREQDPATVFICDGRPYWMDLAVIPVKIFFGLAGAGVIDAGLPALGHCADAPVNQAFYWTAAGGGGFSFATGIGSQAAQGMSPFRKYYRNYRWWAEKSPVLNL